MQFIIVEWEVYSLTKDPLSLGLIGLVEVVPAISMALFAGHIVDQREKKMLFFQCIIAFLLVATGYYFITSPYVYENYENFVLQKFAAIQYLDPESFRTIISCDFEILFQSNISGY